MRARTIIYTIICSVLTVCFVLLAVFSFRDSYVRLWEAVKDLGSSIKIYFCELLRIPYSATPSVVDPSEVISGEISLPQTAEGAKSNLVKYFELFFSMDNFKSWGMDTALKLNEGSRFVILLLPCVLLIVVMIKRYYNSSNTLHNVDTKALAVYKWVCLYVFRPIKGFVLGYVEYLKQYSWIVKCWCVVWALSLNLASIVVAFFAYYFFFAVSFDFTTMYLQVYKLAVDLQVVLRVFPYWSLGIIGWLIFDRFRRKIATLRLRHFEARNCGFINELPIVSITCGSMGKKKTTIITDMALSQEVMFRQKALRIMQDNDMKFPYFPWLMLEKQLQKCVEYGTVYNLATVKAWIEKKRDRFLAHGNTGLQLYGYDIERYGRVYDNALSISQLFEVLETYAKAYFIYIVQSSLIVANYSIRTDNQCIDGGNLPLWQMDFFPRRYPSSTRHAHVLDYDVLRLGKKLIEDNPKIGSFEFGVVALSEIGKERGNNLELREVKKGGDDANQKNDLFNSWLKMCRHSATVDHFPFIKVFTDEQRPESWGADARDLCDIVNIAESGEQRLAMPFYTIEDMLSEWLFNWFINLYYDFRFRRGDNTLFVHILKRITAFVFHRNTKIYNRYGYCAMRIERERGTMDGQIAKKIYYLMNRKIYSRRFSTDCFSDFFNDLAKSTKLGLNDYREYATERASVDELLDQNSYFINSLYGILSP